ncbi:LysR family transcriptional regulator [Arthrobacter sp. Soc17.1.1.1]|uniref:LysR family transcriptional regulator n=1 Tax=Arthrobacter sp. Soc17.1.1.1 TaxID=3121277 RepID=UPI002FE4A70A
MYSVNRLRLLREVSIRGTLAAAAQALGYNPSSVSHQLRLLEDEAGVRLLEPVGRKVRLTQEAHILVRHTEGILQHLESAEAEISLTQQVVRGTVRVASFQTANHTLIPPALTSLKAEHPNLQVCVAHISAELAVPALLARDFDIVLQEEYPAHPRPAVEGAEITTIGMDPLLLLTPADERSARLEDLTDRHWVMEPQGTQARSWAEAQCRGAGFEPRIAYESSDVLLHVRLVAAGLAVGLVPGLALAASDARSVRAHPLQNEPARRIVTAVRRGGGHAPAIAAVRQQVSRTAVQQITG